MKISKLIAMLLLVYTNSSGQQLWTPCPLLEQLKRQSESDISYDYSVVLEDMATGQKLDSMQGHLVCSGRRFIDSNTFSFHARTADTYCNLDFTEHTAVIFKIDEFFKKMKMEFADEPNKINLLSGDYLNDAGTRVECDFSNPFSNRVKIYPADEQLLYAWADFRKADNTCIGAGIEWKESADEKQPYKKSLHIYNVLNKVNESAFDLSRVFQFQNGIPVLHGKYERYKITKII